MFTQEELQALQTLLGRVTIQGNEAMAVVTLQAKIAKQLQPSPEPKEDKK